MLKFNRVPKASCNFPQNLEINLGSRSEIMDIGIPCNRTIPRYTALLACQVNSRFSLVGSELT